jgi:hypothetical protein
MFGLIKLGVALGGLLAFCWFGVTYQLGSRTLFQHLRAIGQTRESQELVDGTKQAATPLVDDVRRRIGKNEESPPAPSSTPPDAGAPHERLSSAEQRQLRKLLEKAARE